MSGECYFLFNTLKINTLSDTCNFYLRLLGKILSFESEAELTNLLRVIENKQPILTRHLNDGVSIHIKDKSWKIEGFESLYDVYLDAMNKAESYYEREGGYEEFKEKYSSLYFPEHGTDYSAYLPVSNDYIAKLVNRNGDLYIDNTIVNYKDINSYSQLEDLGLTYPETDESNLTDTKGVEINGYFYINLRQNYHNASGNRRCQVQIQEIGFGQDPGNPNLYEQRHIYGHFVHRAKNFVGIWYNHSSAGLMATGALRLKDAPSPAQGDPNYQWDTGFSPLSFHVSHRINKGDRDNLSWQYSGWHQNWGYWVVATL